MNIAELNNKLTTELKQYIKSEGFVDTGKLGNSIKFKCSFANNDLKMKFDALEYINYLDDGKFLTNFFAKESVNRILSEFLTFNIVIDLDIS